MKGSGERRGCEDGWRRRWTDTSVEMIKLAQNTRVTDTASPCAYLLPPELMLYTRVREDDDDEDDEDENFVVWRREW